MNLKEIEALAKQRNYEEAIAECNELLLTDPGNKIDILRIRAYVYGLIGDYRNALEDREAIFALRKGDMRDYYLAGDDAIDFGDFERAVAYLEEVLRLGNEQNEKWFESAAYLLLAYAQYELGQYDDALVNIDYAIVDDPDCALPLGTLGMCDHKRLRQEIHRRKRHPN